MKIRIRVPKPLGHVFLIGFIMYFGYWTWTHVGSTGELRPTSSTRILFPIWSSTAWDTAGYAWAREGDTIALDYDLALEAGWFSLTVGKKRWFYRRLLHHEQTRSFRRSAAGQLEYRVRDTGVHAIWAGRYSVWRGDARVRWTVRRAFQASVRDESPSRGTNRHKPGPTYGDTAIATGRLERVGHDRSLAVHQDRHRRDGRWRVVAFHASEAPDER